MKSALTSRKILTTYNTKITQQYRGGNDFSVGGGKIAGKNQYNQSQNIILWNMYFFEKGTCGVQWGLGQSSQKLGRK